MTDSRRNFELKIRCTDADHARIRTKLDSLTCVPTQHLYQIDTYFVVGRGRLKLRELRDPDHPDLVLRAELIAYARPTDAGSRWSAYEVVPIAADVVPSMIRGLEMTHDTLVQIQKERLVGIIGHTRVHIDTVRELGAFVELETVIAGQGDAEAETEHRQVIVALGLVALASVAGSYSDLLAARGIDKASESMLRG